MKMQRRAKITVELDRLGYTASKYFIGTEDEVYGEALDWMNAVALQFIADEDIDDPFEQDLIIHNAIHIIEWEDEDPLVMYAIFERDCTNPIYGVFADRADAEEMIFSIAETEVYGMMMTADPMEVIGLPEWDWQEDYCWLMRDYMSAFEIQEVGVFGVRRIED